jgi:exoribonuclease R
MEELGYLYTKNYMTFKVETADGKILKEFSGALAAGKALPGDTVHVVDDGCQLISRAEHPSLVGVIEFNTKVRHGFSTKGVPLYLFTPSNEAYPPMLIASKETGRDNCLALASFEHWDEESTFPRGGLVRVLGLCGDISVEKGAIAFQYSPWTWSKKTIPAELIYPTREGRYVIDKPTINIDPAGCLDIDDTVSLWEEDGIWNLSINISDVAAFVELNPELNFAERLGQTLYTKEGRAIRSMFPARFSEDAFSLVPGEERFCLSLMAKWDGQALFGFTWRETIVQNWASYTYERCLDASEINMPVLKIIVESMGYDTMDTHKWIESLMILYNSEAARLLKIANAGLLRTHDAPLKEKLIQMECLGLPAKELAYPAAQYTTTEQPGGHWGLNKGEYCHASSPIRRFADILNQAVIKKLLRGTVQAPTLYTKYALMLNRLDKAAKAHERDCSFVDCVLDTPGFPLFGIVIEQKEKLSIYVSSWRRTIRFCDSGTWNPGDKVAVGFYANKLGRSWKKKMVYHIEKI